MKLNNFTSFKTNIVENFKFKINFNEKQFNDIFDNKKPIMIGIIALSIMSAGLITNNIDNTINDNNSLIVEDYSRNTNLKSLNSNENIFSNENINNKNNIIINDFSGIEYLKNIQKTIKGNIPFYISGEKTKDGKTIVYFPSFGNKNSKEISNERIISLGIGKYNKNNIKVIHENTIDIFLLLMKKNAKNNNELQEIEAIGKNFKYNDAFERKYKNGLEFLIIDTSKLDNKLYKNYISFYKELEKESGGLIKIKK